jgi:hypothetical protein
MRASIYEVNPLRFLRASQCFNCEWSPRPGNATSGLALVLAQRRSQRSETTERIVDNVPERDMHRAVCGNTGRS